MAAAAHVAGRVAGLGVPRPRPGRTGDAIHRADSPDGPLLVRLLEYVAGVPWYEAGAAGPDRLAHLGDTLARVHAALASFEHPMAYRTHRWDLTEAGQHRTLVAAIDHPE